MSAVPPGGKVAISLIGCLVGQPGLALTAGAASEEPRFAADAARTVRRVSFMKRSGFLSRQWAGVLCRGVAIDMPSHIRPDLPQENPQIRADKEMRE